MAARIAVVGAGAIGSVVAWRLARAGAPVLLAGRGPHLAAIGAAGLRYTDAATDERRSIAVAEVGPALKEHGPCDTVFVAVKAQDVRGALEAAAPLVGDQTTVVALLNGLPWWLSSEPIEAVDPGGGLWRALPAPRVIGAVVHLGAEVVSPGWVRQAGDNRLTLGELDGATSPRVQALAALLDTGGLPTRVHPAIRDEVWTKLVGNLSTNPLSVVTAATLDRLFGEPGLRAVVKEVMLETMTLGASLGVRFPLDAEARIRVGQRLGAFRTSMLQDFERGRPLELGAIADAPLELAARLQVPMPTTMLVRDLARAAEHSRDLARAAEHGRDLARAAERSPDLQRAAEGSTAPGTSSSREGHA
jgi:2-dehydropantoate 2-reductase